MVRYIVLNIYYNNKTVRNVFIRCVTLCCLLQ